MKDVQRELYTGSGKVEEGRDDRSKDVSLEY